MISSESSKSYAGHAFHSKFDKGRSSGDIQVDASGVHFSCEQGKTCLPLLGLSVTLGGASDRLVFLSHPSVADWNIYTADRSILNDSTLQDEPELLPQIHLAHGKRIFNHGVFVGVGLLLLLPLLLLVLFWQELSFVAARQVPASWESELGETTMIQYSADHDILDEASTEALLLPLIQPLLDAVETDRYTYQVKISDAEEINAFALPGGFIVIHSGLILEAETAEEMLGVVAHEIAHVTEQHGLRNIISTAGTFVIVNALLGDVSGLLALIADAAPLLLRQSYSREFEADADEKGFELLQRADIDPSGLVDFFEKIKAEQESNKGGSTENDDEAEGFFRLLSSHPATDQRIADMNESLKNSNWDNRRHDFSVAFARLQERVIAFSSENKPQENDLNEDTN